MNEAAREARKLWNANPCGGVTQEGFEYASLAYFDEVRRRRYEVSDTWMRETIDCGAAKGKRVLEIGFGIGTDLLSFCEGGAEVHGIDVTEEHLRLATRNFALHGRTANLMLCDGAEIAYPSGYFDEVYSLGVLHHIPDTQGCITEAYRVLKPGGEFILGLYYKYSVYHLINMMLYKGLLKGNLFRLGYRGLMSTVERGADGIHVRPLVKTFSVRELRRMLSPFSLIEFRLAHFTRAQIPHLGRFLPASWERGIASRFGWYVIAHATK